MRSPSSAGSKLLARTDVGATEEARPEPRRTAGGLGTQPAYRAVKCAREAFVVPFPRARLVIAWISLGSFPPAARCSSGSRSSSPCSAAYWGARGVLGLRRRATRSEGRAPGGRAPGRSRCQGRRSARACSRSTRARVEDTVRALPLGRGRLGRPRLPEHARRDGSRRAARRGRPPRPTRRGW